jgi:hypothetical protein
MHQQVSTTGNGSTPARDLVSNAAHCIPSSGSHKKTRPNPPSPMHLASAKLSVPSESSSADSTAVSAALRRPVPRIVLGGLGLVWVAAHGFAPGLARLAICNLPFQGSLDPEPLPFQPFHKTLQPTNGAPVLHTPGPRHRGRPTKHL